MITLRPAHQRGHTILDWLDSYHTFSFGEYHDPQHMGFRSLRVINEDRVQPAQGFGMHPHRDMEIITHVLEGALEHRDSMGNHGVIRARDVQRMTAGAGVRHSEFNHSQTEPVHFLQIWILPEKNGLRPSYEQHSLGKRSDDTALQLIASRDGRNGALTVHQDVKLHLVTLGRRQTAAYALNPGRYAWLQVTRGAIELNGTRLTAGDGAAASDERELTMTGLESAEALLFDLA